MKSLFPCSHLCPSSISTIPFPQGLLPLPFSPPLHLLSSLPPTSLCSQFCQVILSISPFQMDLYMFFLGFKLLLSFSRSMNYRLNILCFTACIHSRVRTYHVHLFASGLLHSEQFFSSSSICM